jgi:hypothetical protein
MNMQLSRDVDNNGRSQTSSDRKQQICVTRDCKYKHECQYSGGQTQRVLHLPAPRSFPNQETDLRRELRVSSQEAHPRTAPNIVNTLTTRTIIPMLDADIQTSFEMQL